MAWYYYLIISLLLLVLAFEIYHAKPHWNIWQKLKFNKKPKKLALELLREQYAPYEVKWSKVSLNPSVDLSKMYYNSRPVRDSDQLVAMSFPNYDRQRQYMVVIGIYLPGNKLEIDREAEDSYLTRSRLDPPLS